MLEVTLLRGQEFQQYQSPTPPKYPQPVGCWGAEREIQYSKGTALYYDYLLM
jgi:hypothetical protein